MEKLLVTGGKALQGRITVGGAKNAVLPIVIAALLAKTPSRFDEVPMLEDVRTISQVLRHLGVKVDDSEPNVLTVDSGEITSVEPPYDLVSKKIKISGKSFAFFSCSITALICVSIACFFLFRYNRLT